MGESSEREAFYDAEIAPALADMARRCQDRGLSFLAVVEWEPGETGRTYIQAEESGYGIRLAETAARAGNNVDALIMAIMKHARQHGHSSMCLKMLGVPVTPPTSGEAEGLS